MREKLKPSARIISNVYRQQSRPQTILNTHTHNIYVGYTYIKRQPWWPNRLYSSAARSFFQRNITHKWLYTCCWTECAMLAVFPLGRWWIFVCRRPRCCWASLICFLAIITWHLLDALWCNSRVWCYYIERLYLSAATHNRNIIRNRVVLIRFQHLFEWYWIPGRE